MTLDESFLTCRALAQLKIARDKSNARPSQRQLVEEAFKERQKEGERERWTDREICVSKLDRHVTMSAT